ncbi:MAG: tape measure protein [Devosia sp.]
MNSRLNSGFTGLQKGIAAAFAGAAALRGAQQLIDSSIRIENSLKVAGLAGEELGRVYDQLYASAQRNAAPVESLVQLYGRAAIVQKELGVSTEELLGFTDNVAVALRVAGTDAQGASGALLQLSQALGAGTVRAEEFNSILEGALPIAQAAAAGLEEAGGSVAKLRALVVDGKVSSEAFFRAFEAGSVILKDKVAGSELTVSQAFVRLQNVLIDVAGKFNESTNASASFANSLDQLGNAIEAAGNSKSLDRLLAWLNDAGNANLQGTVREIEQVTEAIDYLQSRFDKYGGSVKDSTVELAQAEQALANFATNTAGSMGEVDAAAQDLFQQVLEGKGSADLAAEAIKALGDANPDFSDLLNNIGGVIQRIYELRGAAIDATRVDVSGAPMSYAGQDGAVGGKPKPSVKTVSITDYVAPSSSGKSGGKSKLDSFNEAIAAQERETKALQRKTALLSQLNPLVNDYGFAVEQLNAQLELENAAAKAGIELTPERQAQIALLSQGYAQATSDAARLAEAQDKAKESADALAKAGEQAMSTVVDGLLEGKDAGDILNSVLKDLTRSLIDIGVNMIKSNIGSILGGAFGGGGGLKLGYQSGVPGFASGTANTGGRRGQPVGVVHGQEAVVPLPGGGKIPVDLRMPSLPQSGGGQSVVRVDLAPDLEGRILQRSGMQSIQIVQSSAPAIVEQGASAAGAKLGKGEFDSGMRRYGVQPQAKRR